IGRRGRRRRVASRGAGHAEDLTDRLHRLDRLIDPELRALRDAEEHVLLPAWRRVTQGERRWPVALAALAAIGMQLALPDRVATRPRWLLPLVAALLLVGIVAANPGRIGRPSAGASRREHGPHRFAQPGQRLVGHPP